MGEVGQDLHTVRVGERPEEIGAQPVGEITYAYDALERLADPGELGAAFWVDVAVIVGATVLALVLGAITLRRRTP